MFLYQLKFPNGKAYIGITKQSIEKRFKAHCAIYHNKNPCQRAIHKYGKENVVLIVLATVDNYELLKLAEIEAIEKFNTFHPSGYNMTRGGDGIVGFSHNEKSRQKMSLSQSKRVSTPESRRKCSESMKALMTPEKRTKMSAVSKGVKKTEEHKRNVSIALKAMMTPEYRAILSARGKGKHPMSNELRAKLSIVHKGKKASPEARIKMSLAGKGRKQSESQIEKRMESKRITNLQKKHNPMQTDLFT